MTYILGINGRPCAGDRREKGHGGNHNSAACILKDGKLLAFVEEERFTHIKQDGSFPVQSIKYCLKEANITIKDVDYIAIGWLSFRDIFFQRMGYFIRSGLMFRVPTFCLGMSWFALKDWLSGDIQGAFRKNFKHKFRKEQFKFIPHHLAHASSAYRASGFESAGIVTFDGAGETTATMLAQGKGDEIKVLEEFKIPESLGFCYSGFTEYLGFQKNNDEYKVMGLACYGRANKKMDDTLKLTKDGRYRVDVKSIYRFNVLKRRYNYERLREKFGAERPDDDAPITQRHKDVAASIQKQLENASIGLVNRLVRKTKEENLCLAGGVALNCKMNQRIREKTKIKNLFVQPAAADMGVALGAALEVSAQLGEKSRFHMTHCYWGPSYENKEIERALKKAKLKFKKVKDISSEAAVRIHQNKVVGWYQGRMEVGPRALGNRSILANPCTEGMDDLVNEKIKFREKWRPFCPSLIDEAKERYFEKPYVTPFMVLTFTVRKEMRKFIPSVVHVDGTARPQTVTQTENPRYYKLISEFGKLSGHPIVMNTSFNIKGDTIVNTPDDAIRTFLKTDMDVLAIGDYLVEKQ